MQPVIFTSLHTPAVVNRTEPIVLAYLLSGLTGKFERYCKPEIWMVNALDWTGKFVVKTRGLLFMIWDLTNFQIKSPNFQIKSQSNHLSSNQIFSSQIKSQKGVKSWFKSNHDLILPIIDTDVSHWGRCYFAPLEEVGLRIYFLSLPCLPPVQQSVHLNANLGFSDTKEIDVVKFTFKKYLVPC
jgi:hypothetical protein